jgi:hypothetical protein
MRKAKREAAQAATPAQEPGESAFQPTQAQRAFVSAAAGLGVPRRVICRMLPGAEPGEMVSISAHMLRDHFSRELREGMKYVVALVCARVCQRAISADDRGALQAQALVLNAGGWKLLPEATLEDGPDLNMDALTQDERHELKRLLAKAMEDPENGDRTTTADVVQRRRRRRKYPPVSASDVG